MGSTVSSNTSIGHLNFVATLALSIVMVIMVFNLVKIEACALSENVRFLFSEKIMHRSL